MKTYEEFINESREAQKLMSLDNKAWNKLNINSGDDLYDSPDNQIAYIDYWVDVLTKDSKLKDGIKNNAAKVGDELEDDNYNALYAVLSLLGLFGEKSKKNYTELIKKYPDHNFKLSNFNNKKL